MSLLNPPPQLPLSLQTSAEGPFFRALMHSIYLIFTRSRDVELNGVRFTSGAGTPESSVKGSIGDMFTRTDGGANTTLYVKESGAGTNTGWAAK